MRKLVILAVLIGMTACSDDPASNNANNQNNENNLNNENNANNQNNTNNANNANNQNNTNNVNNLPDMGDGDTSLQTGWFDATSLAAGPRQETAVVAYDGKVHVVGGYNDAAQIVATHEIYDPETDTWENAAETPEPLHHANLAVVGDRIYLVGFLGQAFAADGRTFIYDPTEDEWTPGVDMPNNERRGSSGVGVIDGKIYLVGGLRGGAVDDVSVFDPQQETWETLAPFPRPIDHMGFGVIDGKLVIAGGRDGNVNGHYDNTEIYDPTTDEWTAGASIPTARGGVAAAVSKNRLFVFGGEGNGDEPTGVFEEVEAYDLASDTWVSVEPMKTPRHGLGAATVNEAIYLPGGATRQLFEATDIHEVYIPE